MAQYREIAYAKINLALHVRRRRDDGYHELETLFAFVDQGDVLTLSPSNSLTLQCDGPFGAALTADKDNLVLRAARLLAKTCSVSSGAALHLTKNLPIASGIGGGSADAAATLRLLNGYWRCGLTKVEMAQLAVPLGADIPACINSETVRGTGTGTILSPVRASTLADLPILLVNPGIALSTGPIFAAWDGIDRGSLTEEGGLLDIAASSRNDLQAPAMSICPPISDVLSALWTCKPLIARMSGSGATCFALFNDMETRDNAVMQIAADHPNWWQLSGKLR